MTPEYAIGILGRTLEMALLLAAPLLAAGLAVGILVSLFQAITQIHEAALAFVPKAVVLAVMLLLLGPWLIERMTHFTAEMAQEMVSVARAGKGP